MAYSLAIRLDAPIQTKSATINVEVGTDTGHEGTAMGRAGIALLAMLPWKRQDGEDESKDDNGTEEEGGDDHEEDGHREYFPIVGAKPCGDALPKRNQSHCCHPGRTNQRRVAPTAEDGLHFGAAGH